MPIVRQVFDLVGVEGVAGSLAVSKDARISTSILPYSGSTSV